MADPQAEMQNRALYPKMAAPTVQPGDWKRARDVLAQWRAGSESHSREVVAIGKWLLPDFSSNLGDEGSPW